MFAGSGFVDRATHRRKPLTRFAVRRFQWRQSRATTPRGSSSSCPRTYENTLPLSGQCHSCREYPGSRYSYRRAVWEYPIPHARRSHSRYEYRHSRFTYGGLPLLVAGSPLLVWTFPLLVVTFPLLVWTFPLLVVTFPLLVWAFPLLVWTFPLLVGRLPLLESVPDRRERYAAQGSRSKVAGSGSTFAGNSLGRNDPMH